MTSKEIKKIGLGLATAGLLLIVPKLMTQYHWISVSPGAEDWTTITGILGFIVAPAGFMLIVNSKHISGEHYGS